MAVVLQMAKHTSWGLWLGVACRQNGHRSPAAAEFPASLVKHAGLLLHRMWTEQTWLLLHVKAAGVYSAADLLCFMCLERQIRALTP